MERTENERLERIRLAFRHAGLTQEELAEKLGIKRTTVGALLRGDFPGDKHLAGLAQALDVPLPWLLYGISAPAWANRGIAPGSAAEAVTIFVEQVLGITRAGDATATRRPITLDEVADADLDGDDGLFARSQAAGKPLHDDVKETLRFGQNQVIKLLEREVPAAARRRIEAAAARLEDHHFTNAVTALLRWREAGPRHAAALNETLRELYRRQYGETPAGLEALRERTGLERWREPSDDEPPF